MTRAPGTDRPDFGIRELAERTGVPPATLRTWESRYGVPQPSRLAGGHRRYDDRDVELVHEVLRLRGGGLSLSAAVAQAEAAPARPVESLFATLRRRHPAVPTRVLTKRSLLALTRAIEDECCARAERPVLFAAFQHQRYYRAAAPRWDELARTAQYAAVFADFGRARRLSGASPVRVNLHPKAPLRREWFVVCDSHDLPICLVASELPGEAGEPDRTRRFDMLWSVDPRVVRDAATTCNELIGRGDGSMLSTPPGRPSSDLIQVESLIDRFIGYLDAASS